MNEPYQTAHIPITGIAVNHRRPQDSVGEAAVLDRLFSGKPDGLAGRIKSCENCGGADENCAMHSCVFRRCDNPGRMAESKRRQIGQYVDARHCFFKASSIAQVTANARVQ
jgi:hypothetical protein